LDHHNKDANIKINIALNDEQTKTFKELFDIYDNDGPCGCTTIGKDGVVFAQFFKGSIIKIHKGRFSYKHEEPSKYIMTCSGNSDVIVFDKFVVTAQENSKILVAGKTKVFAYDHATVIGEGDSNVISTSGSPKVSLYNNATAEIRSDARIACFDKSEAHLYLDAVGRANRTSTIHAHDRSKAYGYESSVIFAYDMSTIYATNSAIVNAHDFSNIYKLSELVQIRPVKHFGVVAQQVFEVKEDMLVYKKLEDNKICVLKLEKGQKFQSEKYSKCRTDRAFVVSIESIDGKEKYNKGFSLYLSSFIYEVGTYVSAVYDPYIMECSSGIHFFLKRSDAEEFWN
jgi:hypothetical protein